MELGRDQVEALDLWRRVTVTTVRSDAPDLTARQLAVLMTVRLQPAPHTVRGLAAALNVGKPAITRALAEGVRVNVTLIFSVERYREVMQAYMEGLERAPPA